MNNDEKAYELFDIEDFAKEIIAAPEPEKPEAAQPAVSQAATRVVEDLPSEIQQFDFDDVMVDEAPTKRVPKEPELDLDGNPVGGTEEQKRKQYNKDRRRTAGTVLAGIFSWVKEIAIALIVVWFVITFVAQNNQVVGTSMQPTVYANDMVIVNKFIYRFSEPKRGDIIVFPAVENGKKVFLIKRIIGLPGDVVDIRDGKVYINDKEYEEDYIDIETNAVSGQVSFPITVPDAQYFVLGDNRIISKDSRYLSIGTIPRSKITGKASIRIWPFKSIGFIE